MNTIQKKILWLSLSVWLIMAGIWLFMSFNNRKSIENYNHILHRYLLMNQIPQLSQQTMDELNLYLENPNAAAESNLKFARDQLRSFKERLVSLRNNSNRLTLTDYQNMIDSQIAEVDLAIVSFKGGRLDEVSDHYDEALMISDFIANTTLTLLNEELMTYNHFYRAMIEKSNDLNKMGLWTLAFASFLLLLLSYRISRKITRPILALTQAARELSRGNFDNDIEINSKDEIAFLARTFNRMRINIHNLIAEIRAKAQIERDLQEYKLLLKESELKSLQSQINPHFLFNTLNTISKKAYLQGAQETSVLINSVSALLRYNLSRLDRSVTIRDELGCLKEYLTIQKERFTDRIQYTIEADESCLDFQLPSLTLQPFVENAFIHGLEPLESQGMLDIRIKDHSDFVTIAVRDNGLGMSEEKIKAIQQGDPTEKYRGHSTGIGIHNVIRRLRLFYDTQDVVDIASAVGQGTCITLRLPKTRREQGENIDRG
ncbi:MAG TPA: sensor histidine kinase [Bacilli bacterium]